MIQVQRITCSTLMPETRARSGSSLTARIAFAEPRPAEEQVQRNHQRRRDQHDDHQARRNLQHAELHRQLDAAFVVGQHVDAPDRAGSAERSISMTPKEAITVTMPGDRRNGL